MDGEDRGRTEMGIREGKTAPERFVAAPRYSPDPTKAPPDAVDDQSMGRGRNGHKHLIA